MKVKLLDPYAPGGLKFMFLNLQGSNLCFSPYGPRICILIQMGANWHFRKMARIWPILTLSCLYTSVYSRFQQQIPRQTSRRNHAGSKNSNKNIIFSSNGSNIHSNVSKKIEWNPINKRREKHAYKNTGKSGQEGMGNGEGGSSLNR